MRDITRPHGVFISTICVQELVQGPEPVQELVQQLRLASVQEPVLELVL